MLGALVGEPTGQVGRLGCGVLGGQGERRGRLCLGVLDGGGSWLRALRLGRARNLAQSVLAGGIHAPEQ